MGLLWYGIRVGIKGKVKIKQERDERSEGLGMLLVDRALATHS